MSESLRVIGDCQEQWARNVARDKRWAAYVAELADNVFGKRLSAETRADFEDGNGSELRDGPRRPAKMRALGSSSALAVNFFDPWRLVDKTALQRALDLPSGVAGFQFEFKTREYPVRPRSPNLDILLRLLDGRAVGVESKFTEPYSSDDGHGVISARYFPQAGLWDAARLPAAQRLADRLKPEWIHLDVPQLLKHLLGLASDPERPGTLLYIWYDTGRADAIAHLREIERFAAEVANEPVAFHHITYQSVFGALTPREEPMGGWHEYMSTRYFNARAG